MRVVHLVDLRFAPWSVLAGVIDARAGGGEHAVVLLGGTTALSRARAAGVPVDLRLAPPVGSPRACRSVLGRALAGLGPFDVMHAWSGESCVLAEDVCAGAAVVASVFESPACMAARKARRAVDSMRRASALQFGDEVTRGAWLDTSDPPAGEVVVGPPRIPDWGRRGDDLRRMLGIGAEMGVIVAASEPGESIDAMLCMYIVGVLSERGMSATVIVPSDATGLDRAERFSVYHMGKWTVRVCDRPVWECLSIADGVVVADRAPCDGVRRFETIVTGAQWGAMLGLPVLAPRVERYERVLRGDVRWVEAGDRLGFVRAAHDVLRARPGGGCAPARPDDGDAPVDRLYRLCGLVNA